MKREPAAAGALDDLCVVELGEGVAAAYAAKLLADFGARTIKVERPAGDPSRTRGPFPNGTPDPEASGLFAYLNTNKLGVVIDLDGGKETHKLHMLLEAADIFVTDLPAGVLRSAGLAPAELRRHFPSLVIATISPFGDSGPWSGWVGDELTAFAASGLAYGTPGIPDAADDLYAEPPLHPSCFVSETLAGVSAATAVLAAVTGRKAPGDGGCHIDLSTQAASAAIQVRDLMPTSYSGARYNRELNPVSIGRMPNFYLPCKDGNVTVAAPMDVHWQRLVGAMGRPDWACADVFSSEKTRHENWEELRTNLAQWTLSRTSEELYRLGEEHKIMIFPFFSVGRMAGSEHVHARSSLTDVSIGAAAARMPGAPFKMERTPWALRRPSPRLGEHDDLVFDNGKRASA